MFRAGPSPISPSFGPSEKLIGYTQTFHSYRRAWIQVKEIMKTNDAQGISLLSLVAASGGENAFQTVLGALHEALDGNEVRHFNRDHHSNWIFN